MTRSARVTIVPEGYAGRPPAMCRAAAEGGRCLCCTIRLMRVHLITAESPASRRLRRGRLIQFPQLTMPLIAALTPREHEVSHTDEIVDSVRLDVPVDLVGLPAP